MTTYTRTKVAVFDVKTGAIRQVVECLERDKEVQHTAFAGHSWADVTDQGNVHPLTHAIDITTGKAAPRSMTLDEASRAKTRVLNQVCTQAITGGFSSSAAGAALHYPSSEQDQQNMAHAALVGGDLWAMDDKGSWGDAPRHHDQAQALAVFKDFVLLRDAARARLAKARTALAAAQDNDAVAKVTF